MIPRSKEVQTPICGIKRCPAKPLVHLGLGFLSDFGLRISDLALASVIGLAPIRPGLKGRLLELLCIHGHSSAEWTATVNRFSFRTPHSALRTPHSNGPRGWYRANVSSSSGRR